MNRSSVERVKIAAEIAANAARNLLTAAEDIPKFGPVAKLILKLLDVLDQFKCNKEASLKLQLRFCRLADHLFNSPLGLVSIGQSRPSNTSIAIFCAKMESILTKGEHDLCVFTKAKYFDVLRGSKPKIIFDELDQDMTQCLNELSVALQTNLLAEQAQTYEVVCNIQDKIDQRGGLEGLLADPAQLQWLATEIGADVSDLQVEVSSALAALRSQVSAVDENVRKIGAKMDQLHRAMDEIQKSLTKAADLSSLQLTSRPVVDRSQLLGVGAFGKVYRGTYNHMEVAVKEMNVTVALTAAQLSVLASEVQMHSKVANLPGVAHIFGANLTVEPRSIVLELADVSLHDALHKRTLSVDFSLSTKLSVAAQLCATMAAISSLNITHGNMKSSNVLLFLGGRRGVVAKLSDFGLNKVVNESAKSSNVAAMSDDTLSYMAPELFRVDGASRYSSASDMYAFAVLLNELLSEQVPFLDSSYWEILQSVGAFHQRPMAFRAQATDEVGLALVGLIAQCWHQDPALRMSFEELGGGLTHLLRKTVECARVGDNATPQSGLIRKELSVFMDGGSPSARMYSPRANAEMTTLHMDGNPVVHHEKGGSHSDRKADRTVSFIHDVCCPLTMGDRVTLIAATRGHLECLNRGLEVYISHPEACTGAACGGHLDCLMRLHEVSAPWDESTTTASARRGDYPCLSFAINRGCPYESESVVMLAAESGNLQMLQYLIRDCGLGLSEAVFSAALLRAHHLLIDYLLDEGCPYQTFAFGGANEWPTYKTMHGSIPDVDARLYLCIVPAIARSWCIVPIENTNRNRFDNPDFIGYLHYAHELFPMCVGYMVSERWMPAIV